MATRFDAFARALADDLSRRSALQRLGAGFSALFFGVAACEADRGTAPLPNNPSLVVSAAAGGGRSCHCKSNQVCFNNNCTCPPGKQHCIANDSCVDYCGAGQVLDANCACVSYCGAGTVLCNGNCVSNSCPAGQHFDSNTCGCVADGCPAGQTLCGGTCINTSTDVNNCGQCGVVCSVANGNASCVAGICTVAFCSGSFANCDGQYSTGCEVDTATDIQNCGACNTACPPVANATSACNGGTCISTCLAGFDNCDGNPATGCETNLNTNSSHCGACGTNCGPFPCVNGVCNTFCTIDANCPAGYYCASGSCQLKQANGAPCTGNSQCASNNCQAGICVA